MQDKRRILAAVQGLGPDDLVLALISGGGSALMALPAPGLTLAHKQAVNRALLHSGATIHEMNCVRKHLSAIKGGRLAAAAHPAHVVTLAISDVPGDDPAVIASGPTVPDPTSFADARALIDRYGIELPPEVAAHLDRAEDETPKPGDPRLAGAAYRMIAAPQMALQAAAEQARALGLAPLILGDAIEGESAVVGTVMAGIARGCRVHGTPASAPSLLLSGGETTVTIKGHPLTVTADGTLNAEAKADTILVEGTVTRSLTAESRMTLRATANVSGEIQAPILSVAEGAKLQGKVSAGPRKNEAAA